MQEKALEFVTLVMYALAAISGGLGGCSVASSHILKGQAPRAAFVMAHGMIGAMFGVLTMAWGTKFGIDTSDLDSVIGYAVAVGAVGSLTLAGSNLSARWVLKRLGVEVEVSVKRRGDL